jgi:CelD/BcsL family acetyltransferase involved in cellulose biosynthesis
MLAIHAITDAAGLTALKEEWQALAGRSSDATLFQTWEWQSTWWRHFGRGRLWILTARDGETLVGLAPLYISRYHGLPLRRVAFLGTGASDYLDVVTLPDRAIECRAAFFHYLACHRRAWDLVDLQQWREDALLAGELPPPELPSDLRATVLTQETCPYVRLPRQWDGFAAGLGKKLRGNIGYYRRLLAREFAVECETITNGELQATMDELFHLHQRRWRRRGLPGAFADPRARQFHTEVAERLLERGWLRLHRLRLDGTTRAALYCFRFGTKGYYYLGGFEPSMARYSLGTVLTAHAIEDAIASGAEEFDFLRGDEPYKYAWKPQERRNLRLLIWKRSFPSCLTPRLNQAERHIERQAKRLARRLSERRRTSE